MMMTAPGLRVTSELILFIDFLQLLLTYWLMDAIAFISLLKDNPLIGLAIGMLFFGLLFWAKHLLFSHHSEPDGGEAPEDGEKES